MMGNSTLLTVDGGGNDDVSRHSWHCGVQSPAEVLRITVEDSNNAMACMQT